MDAAAPGIGHNSSNYSVIAERATELALSADTWAKIAEIVDDETATKADAFLTQVETELKAAKAQFKIEKQPWLDGGREVDDRWRPVTSVLETIKGVIGPRVRKYLADKQARLDRERAAKEAEARRLIEEAEAAAAKAAAGTSVTAVVEAQVAAELAEEAAAIARAASVRAAVKSSISERARSLRTTWKAEVVNVATAFLVYRDHPDVRETLERLASAEARGGKRTLPGFKIFEVQS